MPKYYLVQDVKTPYALSKLSFSKLPGTKRIKKCTDLIISKPKWKKCDIEVHRSSIKENIMEIDNLEDITTVEIIEKLENVLHNVVKQSIPKYRKKQ